MKIKERLRLNTWISVGTIVLMALTLGWLFRETSVAARNVRLADELRKAAFDRILLRDEYLLHREERARTQWYAKSETLRTLLASADERFTDREGRALLRGATKDFDTTYRGFSELVDKHKHKELAEGNKVAFSEAELRLISQVLVNAYALNDKIMSLYALSLRAATEARDRGITIVALLVVVSIVAVSANSTLVSGIVVKRLSVLTRGVGIIGAGNLDHRIQVGGADELSDLARASNEMAAKLTESYTSVANLEREKTEREQAEEALRQSEEAFRALAENAYDGIIVTVDDGVQAYANERTGELVGYTVAELLDSSIRDLLHPDELEKVTERYRKRLAGESAPPHYETVLARRDGTSVPVELTTAQTVWRGKLAEIAIIRDITERRQIEGELERNRERLEESVKERTAELAATAGALLQEVGERRRVEEEIRRLNEELMIKVVQLDATNQELEAFCYSVSHDLRAPLRSIDGFSQALLDDYLDLVGEDGRDCLHRIRGASQRMGELIDDLLKLSCVSRGEMRHETVDLHAIVQAISEELKGLSPQRQVDVIVAPGVVEVKGDRSLLTIAMVNLLDNAFKFTRPMDRPRIEFGMIKGDGNGPIYFVADNGTGFDMAYVGKLFTPFQRLHSRDEFEGTGIGLATVQRIIRRHGGRIWAEGEPGKGATFFFTTQSPA